MQPLFHHAKMRWLQWPTLTPINVPDGKGGYRVENSSEIRERWRRTYGK